MFLEMSCETSLCFHPFRKIQQKIGFKTLCLENGCETSLCFTYYFHPFEKAKSQKQSQVL